MSVHSAYAPAVSGPSEARLAFLRKVGLWTFGGVFGLVLCGVFVVASGASLLYALNVVVHEMDDDMHVEAAYEITMKLLVLLWNIIQLLNRVRR
jgi:hypothetical protein